MINISQHPWQIFPQRILCSWDVTCTPTQLNRLSVFSFYLFYLKYEASMFLPNVDNLLPFFFVSHRRRKLFRTSNLILHDLVFVGVFYSRATFSDIIQLIVMLYIQPHTYIQYKSCAFYKLTNNIGFRNSATYRRVNTTNGLNAVSVYSQFTKWPLDGRVMHQKSVNSMTSLRCQGQ